MCLVLCTVHTADNASDNRHSQQDGTGREVNTWQALGFGSQVIHLFPKLALANLLSEELACSVKIHKLVVLPVRQIQESLITQMRPFILFHVAFSLLVMLCHTLIKDFGWLAVRHAFPFLQLVEEHEVCCLNACQGHKGNKDAEDFAEAGMIAGCISGCEEKGANDVAGAAASVVQGHHNGLFRCQLRS